MRHEVQLAALAAGVFAQVHNLRRMPMAQRFVRVHVAMSLGVMRSWLWAATGTGAAGCSGHKEFIFGHQ